MQNQNSVFYQVYYYLLRLLADIFIAQSTNPSLSIVTTSRKSTKQNDGSSTCALRPSTEQTYSAVVVGVAAAGLAF